MREERNDKDCTGTLTPHTLTPPCSYIRSSLPTCLMPWCHMAFAQPLWRSSNNVSLSQSSLMKTAKPEPAS